MDLQSENDPQPSGKINKAAFKLFGKRKPGSPVSSIFSIRSKGEGGKSAAKSPLVRSNTHDGIMETPAELEGKKKEESMGGNIPYTDNEAIPAVSPRTSFSSITSLKSLSFLTHLRRRSRAGEGGRSAFTEPRPGSRRRKGLKGLFSSVRWHRKDQGARAEQEEPPPPALLLASRSNSVEIVKEHMTLTPRPPPRAVDAQTPTTPEPDEDVSIPATMDDGSPLMEMAGDQWNKIFFPYSALATKEMLTLPTANTTEAEDKANNTSSRTEDSKGDQERSERQGTDMALDEDGLEGKSKMVAEEKACPALTSVPKVTPVPASAPRLKPASAPSSSFFATSASPGMDPILSSASIPAPTLSPATVPKPTPPIASLTSTPGPAHAVLSTPIHAHTSSPDHKTTPAPACMAASISAYTPTPSPVERPSLPPTHPPTCTSTPTPVPTHRPSQPLAQTPIPVHTPTPTSAPAHSPSPPPIHTPTLSPVDTPSSTPTPVVSPVSTHIPSPVPSPVPPSVSGYVPGLNATHPPGFKLATASTKSMVSMDTEEDISGRDKVRSEAMTCTMEEVSSRENVLGRAMTYTEKGKEFVTQDGVEVGEEGEKNLSNQDDDIKGQIQGLQHVMLQREEDSPVSPPSSQPGPRRPEKRPPPVKALGLSKIPVSGCTRVGKQPREAPHEDRRSKDPQDIPPNYDEGYWDSTTPGLDEEGASFLAQEEDESPGPVAAVEKTTPVSTHEPKLTPSTLGSGRSVKGNSNLPRDSKIPIKQPTSNVVSPGLGTSAATPTAHTHGTKTEALRTKIPVSKVPVRRTSARSAPLYDHPRK